MTFAQAARDFAAHANLPRIGVRGLAADNPEIYLPWGRAGRKAGQGPVPAKAGSGGKGGSRLVRGRGGLKSAPA